MAIYAETTMLKTLKENKYKLLGQDWYWNGTDYKVSEVRTELKNGYYHGVGVYLEADNGKTKFNDVYSLTMWGYDKLMTIIKDEKK